MQVIAELRIHVQLVFVQTVVNWWGMVQISLSWFREVVFRCCGF